MYPMHGMMTKLRLIWLATQVTKPSCQIRKWVIWTRTCTSTKPEQLLPIEFSRSNQDTRSQQSKANFSSSTHLCLLFSMQPNLQHFYFSSQWLVHIKDKNVFNISSQQLLTTHTTMWHKPGKKQKFQKQLNEFSNQKYVNNLFSSSPFLNDPNPFNPLLRLPSVRH